LYLIEKLLKIQTGVRETIGKSYHIGLIQGLILEMKFVIIRVLVVLSVDICPRIGNVVASSSPSSSTYKFAGL